MKSFILGVSMVLLLSPVVSAVPILYNVSGAAGIELEGSFVIADISGELYLNDNIYTSGDPNDWFYFEYLVPCFNIRIGTLSFSGSGNIVAHHYGEITTPFDAFSLRGGGDFSRWDAISGGTNFFYKNGNAYDNGPDPSDFYNLPHRIFSEMGGFIEGNLFDAAIFNLDITRAASPVPEPATVLLFGIGLICFIGKRGFLKTKKL